MISDTLGIGDKIDVLKWENAVNKDGELMALTSRILDFVDEKTIKILMPMDKSRIVPLGAGETYSMYFYTKVGTYMSKATVKDRFSDEGMGILVVELVSSLEKLQRRRFFRVECVLDIQSHVLTEKEREILEEAERDLSSMAKMDYLINSIAIKQDEWETGMITDISGGGICYITKVEKHKGDIILLSMELVNGPEARNHKILARNLSSAPIEKKPGFFENRAQFIKLSTVEREEIIRFVFEEDRKKRKRERGN
jgi:c-di-GMP-binding flagellar brake protein YcgR